VSNVVLSTTEAQLNLLVVPSKEHMQNLFERLCTAVIALKTDSESVHGFFDSIISVFKRVTRDRLALVTESFERAQGLDILERF